MLKRLLIVVVLLLAAFLVVAAMQPAEFRVTRRATLAAPPAAVFARVNDLRQWNEWSPWARLDPSMRQTFEGPPAGVGASSAWAGNYEVGEGRMTITDSVPEERVVLRLEFLKPMAATNTTEFLFQPEAGGTAVTWTMSGANNFVGKCVGLLMNCEKMVGGQFEQGLENLRGVVTRAPQS